MNHELIVTFQANGLAPPAWRQVFPLDTCSQTDPVITICPRRLINSLRMASYLLNRKQSG
jgi:hypothetical protein